MDHFIVLPHGAKGEGFMVNDLVTHLQRVHQDHIIQGQVNCVLANHPKPNSLDVWIRTNHTRRKDTKQATNDLLRQIIDTGLFKLGKYTCPDSGRKCKGIQLIQDS